LILLRFIKRQLAIIKNGTISFFRLLKLLRNEKVLPSKAVMLYFDHDSGGGTGFYTNKFLENYNKDEYLLIKWYRIESKKVAYCVEYNGFTYIVGLNKINLFLISLNVNCLYINSLVGFPKLKNLITTLIDVKRFNECNLIIAFHDYFPLCYNLNLFCHHKSCKNYCSQKKVLKWRTLWNSLLEEADELRVFSDHSKEVLLNYIPEFKNKIRVHPHSLEYLKDLKPIEYKKTPLNIGVLGLILNEIKGINILEELLKKYQIHLFGRTSLKNKNLINHGTYDINNIRQLLVDVGINLIVFTSVCEETFSFVVSEVIAMGLPIICFDVGAQSEKVRNYEKGIVVKDVIEMEKVIDERFL